MPMEREIVLDVRGVHHWFGPTLVLYDVNLRIIRGEIVALVGPSGCGKSTLLRAIIGTHPPEKGEIVMIERDRSHSVVRSPGRDRGIVYQNYSLFPFLTARENVAMGLMLDQTSIPYRMFRYGRWRRMRREHLREAGDLLDRLMLGHAADQYPSEMSGGMRQRVAIAQTMIMKPRLMMLDEPFGALDEATREDLQRMLLTLYQENCRARQEGQCPPYTIMIVTHELNEAIYVGDRVVGLSQYWDWRKEGLERSPGATIVYDRVAPVYFPDQERNFETFIEKRRVIREAAFDAQHLQDRNEYLQFWSQLDHGLGEGILA
ncbi:ATP-binding cassette domain-containing protein [bacterium]|nr:ATP-binding cassette domain-containing protein [candidate division CSSED10-310 bacterium]